LAGEEKRVIPLPVLPDREGIKKTPRLPKGKGKDTEKKEKEKRRGGGKSSSYPPSS